MSDKKDTEAENSAATGAEASMVSEKSALLQPDTSANNKAEKASSTASSATKPPGSTGKSESKVVHKPGMDFRLVALLVAVLAIALLGWQWLETRTRMESLQGELARRLSAGDTQATAGSEQARQNLDALSALSGRVAQLENRIAEFQGQQSALDALYQEMIRHPEERLLADTDQALGLAVQQLQIAGNVGAALVALQGIDARLAAANRPRLLPLRRAIGMDIERLKVLPVADVPQMATRIESLMSMVDTMPLAFEAKPAPAATPVPVKPAAPSKQPATEVDIATAQAGQLASSLWSEIWAEIKSLVRIERMEKTDSVLLKPEHAIFLRENLKLRLMNARLTLLQRDGANFRHDMLASANWMERYFDTRAKSVQTGIATLKQLARNEIVIELPRLDDSQAALLSLKVARDKVTSPAPAHAAPAAER